MITILIDSHALAYRAFYTTGSLSHGDRVTGIPFGYFTTLLDLSERFKTNQFAFLWDGIGSRRRSVYKEYKASRWEGKTEEELAERKKIHAQIDALRDDILPACGFKNIFKQDGFEADDLMAKIVDDEGLRVHKRQFVGVSGDHDLFQLLRFPNFKLYTPNDKKLWDASTFSLEFGIPAREWVAVKSIAGCPGDGVPGVPGVAEKSAIAFIKDELKPESVKARAIESAGEIISRNHKLVRLPFPGTGAMKMEEQHWEDTKILLETFKDLGFESFLTDKSRKRWDSFVIRNWKMEELF